MNIKVTHPIQNLVCFFHFPVYHHRTGTCNGNQVFRQDVYAFFALILTKQESEMLKGIFLRKLSSIICYQSSMPQNMAVLGTQDTLFFSLLGQICLNKVFFFVATKFVATKFFSLLRQICLTKFFSLLQQGLLQQSFFLCWYKICRNKVLFFIATKVAVSK